MGWDTVRFFNGTTGESTIITAEKRSADAVYDERFKLFARGLGFTVRQVVGFSALERNESLQERVNAGRLQVTKLPDKMRHFIREAAWDQTALELRPPVDEDMTRVLTAYFQAHCECNDAGIIIDNRQEPCVALGGF
jgi:hypothetical protein